MSEIAVFNSLLNIFENFIFKIVFQKWTLGNYKFIIWILLAKLPPNFRYRFQILLVLLCSKLDQSKVIELKCKIKYDGHENIRNNCDLVQKEPIFPGMEDLNFQFTGGDSKQMKKVQTLIFRTEHVAFVPREAFSTFPNLDRISVRHTNFSTLRSDYFNFFPRARSNNIKTLGFENSKIVAVDPKLLGTFGHFERLLFQNNICVKENFNISNGDVGYVGSKMKPCFDNYVTNSYAMFDRLSRIEEKISSLYRQVDQMCSRSKFQWCRIIFCFNFKNPLINDKCKPSTKRQTGTRKTSSQCSR